VIVYRICKTYPPDHNPLDGKGASKYGGRWNSTGIPMVYTSSSLALARSEMARHINLEVMPDDYRVYEIEIPDQDYIEVALKTNGKAKPLPENWNSDLEHGSSKKIGDAYFSDKSVLAIKVPSVCDHKLYNYLLNPESESYHLVEVVDDYPFIA